MMRQALVALGPKSVMTGVLVGGAALALGALFLPHAAPASPGMYRLVLHAPAEPGAFYLSAWAEGDVFTGRSDAKTLTFVRRGDEHDGCLWQGTERLTRLNPMMFAYDYSETILSCRPDAVNLYRKTPRTGIVTVEKWDGPATPTAFLGIQPPGDPTVAEEDDTGCDQVAAEHDEADVDEPADELDDAQAELADAQEELAQTQRELERAVREVHEATRAALAVDE